MKLYTLNILLLISSACISCSNGKIETGKTLDKETTDLIRSLGLMNKDETIIQYYSNFKKNKAGNFFTTQRIAHYWLDDHNKEKNDSSYAYYTDIYSIDTVYEVPQTLAPYMMITKTDSTKFKVYIDGSKSEIKNFFEEAIKTWKQNRKQVK